MDGNSYSTAYIDYPHPSVEQGVEKGEGEPKRESEIVGGRNVLAQIVQESWAPDAVFGQESIL